MENISTTQDGATYNRPSMRKKERRRERVMNTRSYKIISRLSTWMDRYYIDPLLGIVPGGWGDILSALMVVPYLWFSLFVVRSLPLSLAIIYGVLRDAAIGLLPFFVGDFLDIFNHSYLRNMTLIQGFIDNDQMVIREVNRKAWFFAAAIFVCILIIMLLIRLTVYLVGLIF